MAPEVVRLKSRTAEELARLRRAQQPLYGTAVDLWAVGCVCYELLYGVALFRGESPSVVERKILFQPTQFFPRVSAAMTPVSSSAINFLSVRARACVTCAEPRAWACHAAPLMLLAGLATHRKGRTRICAADFFSLLPLALGAVPADPTPPPASSIPRLLQPADGPRREPAAPRDGG